MTDPVELVNASKDVLIDLKSAIGDLQLTVLDDEDQSEHTKGILDGFGLVNELIDVIVSGITKEMEKYQ